MQPRDDPQAAALFDFVSSYLDGLEQGRTRTLPEWLARFPGHEAAVAREWLALQHASDADGTHDGDRAAAEQRVGPYRVLRELGRGGQGAVFLAEDSRIARRVALKVLASRFDTVSEERRKRFRREAEVIARLEHPGICGIYEAEIEGETPYLAMRYVEGETLASVLARAREAELSPSPSGDSASSLSRIARDWPPRTPFDVRQVLLFFERAARALHAAHEAGVIHRDIKPGNIMVTQDGQPVLLDFGLARDEDSEESELTRSGDIFGTPAYMSPEQLEHASSELDRRTDVYSLGASLYESLTLHRPHEAATRAELYLRISRSPLPDPRRYNPVLTAEVAVVLETALEKDRERRYASALELSEDLRRIREYEPIRARPASLLLRLSRWTRRNPVLAATLLALAGGLSIALYALAGERAALRVALGRHLATRCQALIGEDPAAALVLGIQACELAPNYLTRAALLEALGSCRLERELRCEDAPANGFALAPDGRSLAVAFGGTKSEPARGRVRVFDLAQRGRWFDCEGASGVLGSVAYDRAGARLVAGALDGRLLVWDASDGRARGALELGARLQVLEPARDGARALAIAADGRAALCDLAAPALLCWLAAEPGEVARARFSADGRWLYTAAPAGHARADVLARWDAANGTRAGETRLPAPITCFECDPAPAGDSVLCGLERGGLARVRVGAAIESLGAGSSGFPPDFLAWSPDSARALVCSGQNEGGDAWLVDLATRARTELSAPGQGRVFCAAFSPDGRRVATSSSDSRLRVWDAAQARAEQVLRGRYRAQELRWGADGSRLYMRNIGTGVMAWFAAGLPDVFALPGPRSPTRELWSLPEHGLALGIAEDGSARLWRLAGPPAGGSECLRAWNARAEGGVRCGALAPDGASAVLGLASGALLHVDARDGSTLARVEPAGRAAPRSLGFSADGRHVLAVGDELWLFEPARGWASRRFEHAGGVTCARFVPGLGLASGSDDGRVRGWGLDDLAPRWEKLCTSARGAPLPIRDLCVSDDGSELAVSAGETALLRYASATGAELQALSTFVMRSMSYSPTRRQALLIGQRGGGAIRLLDLDADPRQRSVMLEIFHLDDLVEGSFSPDGELFVTASKDGVCYVRNARGGLPVARAELGSEPRMTAWAGAPDAWQLLVGAADGVHVLPVDPLPPALARRPRELDSWEIAAERRLAAPLRYDP